MVLTEDKVFPVPVATALQASSRAENSTERDQDKPQSCRRSACDRSGGRRACLVVSASLTPSSARPADQRLMLKPAADVVVCSQAHHSLQVRCEEMPEACQTQAETKQSRKGFRLGARKTQQKAPFKIISQPWHCQKLLKNTICHEVAVQMLEASCRERRHDGQ